MIKSIKIFLPCFLIVSFILLSGVSVKASEKDSPDQQQTTSHEKKTWFNPGRWLISFFSNYISPIDGDRCPSVPSCSAYSSQAFKKHGFFIGWIMTVDRLTHEGSEETYVSPVVFSEGRWKIYDPVENNDFWWNEDDNDQ